MILPSMIPPKPEPRGIEGKIIEGRIIQTIMKTKSGLLVAFSLLSGLFFIPMQAKAQSANDALTPKTFKTESVSRV